MASLTFQNFIFFLGSGRPQTRFSSNVVFIFQKSLNVLKDIRGMAGKFVDTSAIRKSNALLKKRLA